MLTELKGRAPVFCRLGVWRGLQVLAVGLPVVVSPMHGQAEPESPATLQVYRRLAYEIGSDIEQRLARGAAFVGGVTVFPREIGLPLEEDLWRGLGVPVTPTARRDSAGLHIEFAVTEARVVLEGLRRDGFLGPKLADRVVFLGGTAKTWGEGFPTMYYEVTRSLRDTIRLSAIDRLESPALGFTKVSVPREGFFDTLLEPLVVLGAVGVAVYLLFAVRS